MPAHPALRLGAPTRRRLGLLAARSFGAQRPTLLWHGGCQTQLGGALDADAARGLGGCNGKAVLHMTTKLLLVALALGLGSGCAMDIEDPEDFERLGTTEDEVTGPGSYQSYKRALIRLDLQGAAPCSAVLVGPNLLVTAAHCVANQTIDGVTQWNGMKYGKIRVRMVYKPSSTETMCLNEVCWNADDTRRYSTIYAFWDSSYAGAGDWSSDMAVLTRITQADFLTKAANVGDPAPRALEAADFLRIQAFTLPTSGAGWHMIVSGYGAAADGTSTVIPRSGPMQVIDWNTHTMEATYTSGGFWAAACKGDSGGPLTFTPTVGGTTYVAGVVGGANDSISGACPEVGDDLEFNRMSSKIWMLDRVRQWIEGVDCNRYSNSSLPGSGEYFRCW